MSYCRIHEVNNCIACELQQQTKALIEAMNKLALAARPPLLCRVFGHRMLPMDGLRGAAGPHTCTRCPYETPGVTWPRSDG